MRDLILVGFLFYAIYYSFKRPYIGAAAWIWIAMTAPANWTFGFSNSFRLNLTIVVITVIAYVFIQKYKHFKSNSIVFWVVTFAVCTLLSTLTTEKPDFGEVFAYWTQFIKIILLFIFVTLTVYKRLHINTLVWAIVLSVSSYAAMEAVKFLLSGGGHRIVGRAGVIQDRNDLAVAINMCIPLIIYLRYQTKNTLVRQGLLALVGLNVISIVGTYSRGGFVGLVILGIAFWWLSDRKILFGFLGCIVIAVFIAYAPGEWKERQNTVASAATEDTSFIGRLWAWKISTMIALDNPLTGGGFQAVTDKRLWAYYAPRTPNFGPVSTPPIPPLLGAKAAHNAYMQVLGDHGFVGLFVFLMILFSTFLTNLRNKKWAKVNDQEWLVKFSSAMNLSLIGYGITANNVSLAYFDLLFAICGLVCAISMHIAVQKKKTVNTNGRPMNENLAT